MADIKKSDVCVMIPAYNEAGPIRRVIKDVRGLGYPVLVVDDGSQDGTAAVAKSEGAEVLTLSVNQGKGAALRRGFEWFLKSGRALVVTMDADGQHDPSELDRFVAAMSVGGADFVVGNRMTDIRNMPLVRVLTNRFMSWLL